jgi:formimidoylglutamate deiminase
MPSGYFAELALLPSGWSRNVRIDVGADGTITGVAVDTGQGDAERLSGALIPGMPNVHSHAFQLALAGRLERAANPRETFWSWREGMYDLAGRLEPDDVESIAAYLYVRMLEAGYTSVGEFHYLHNDRSGEPYASRTEMADRHLRAAEIAGIGITVLLVLYRHPDFGGGPVLPEQRRFVTSVDDLVAMFETLRGRAHVGIAPHSLRAVTQQELRSLLSAVGDGVPIHIHVSEQQREVNECVRRYGSKPVAWLFTNARISGSWTFVHATHVDPMEMHELARSQAVVALCPSTEANLGDGIFPADGFVRAGGQFAIGSDSHVTIDPAEELRLLEYGQRLAREERTILGNGIYASAARAGAQSLGIAAGAIEKGKRADFVTLDLSNPVFAARDASTFFDAWIFGGARNVIKDVVAAGSHVVHDGRHRSAETVSRRYVEVMRRLFA